MQESESLVTEEWPIARVRPYEGNPRVIPDAAVQKVAASIREFGWRQPIVVDEAGVVIVGHTRLKAAQSLGFSTVPVHVARDLSSEQARAYRLADNRVGEESRWDLGALGIELSTLQGFGVDLSSLGFDPVELPRPPDFAPIPEGEVKRLDQVDTRACPNCGHPIPARLR